MARITRGLVVVVVERLKEGEIEKGDRNVGFRRVIVECNDVFNGGG